MFGLLLLNGVLLGALALVTFGPSAEAQVRPRGEYTAVACNTQGALADVVYIVDTVNAEMIALLYEPSTQEMIGLGYRNIRADAAGRLSAGNPR
jgi:hypothetical protein